MILMQENLLQGPLEWVGNENQKNFGLWNGNKWREAIRAYVARNSSNVNP